MRKSVEMGAMGIEKEYAFSDFSRADLHVLYGSEAAAVDELRTEGCIGEALDRIAAFVNKAIALVERDDDIRDMEVEVSEDPNIELLRMQYRCVRILEERGLNERSFYDSFVSEAEKYLKYANDPLDKKTRDVQLRLANAHYQEENFQEALKLFQTVFPQIFKEDEELASQIIHKIQKMFFQDGNHLDGFLCTQEFLEILDADSALNKQVGTIVKCLEARVLEFMCLYLAKIVAQIDLKGFKKEDFESGIWTSPDQGDSDVLNLDQVSETPDSEYMIPKVYTFFKQSGRYEEGAKTFRHWKQHVKSTGAQAMLEFYANTLQINLEELDKIEN